ncbi:ArsR family transcriptional regulator [Haloarchaeobius amylolyticus]|uniref:ArsR family transcriptional regulator n=1 Tax=Haloarchaeobius amylolyticus TaxID=1198296 RepID=A0ABD6BEA9_9EURY
MTEFPITDDDGLVQCACEADEILRLLADASRRRVVESLANYEDTWIHREQLAQRLAGSHEEEPINNWERDLHHVHLPMLEDTGIIEYDRQEGTVRHYQCDGLADVLDAVEPE